MTTVANDMSDRQWVAAFVIDNSPWRFDPSVEARDLRDRLAHQVAGELQDGLTPDRARLAAADQLVGDLIACDTELEQHTLLGAIARGEA